jgi:hypothetical protein
MYASPITTIETVLLAAGARPWSIALATCILLPVTLLLLCWRDRTLFLKRDDENPDAHGLISPINAYLPITIALNYAIFAFYQSCELEIFSLHAQGTFDADTFSAIQRWAFLSPFLAAFAYGVALCIGIKAHRYASTRGVTYTSWLIHCGKSRPIATYFRVFFVLELGLVFDWFLQHVLVWTSLSRALSHARLDPFNPDAMLGLEPLSEITGRSFVVIALVALLVAIWLVGARMTLRPSSFAHNAGHLAAALMTPICAALVVILPLLPAHVAMENAQRRALQALSLETTTTATGLRELAIEGNSADLGMFQQRFTAQLALYAHVHSAITWPVSHRTIGAFPVGFLTPLLLPFLHDVLRKLTRSYRAWKSSSPRPAAV